MQGIGSYNRMAQKENDSGVLVCLYELIGK